MPSSVASLLVACAAADPATSTAEPRSLVPCFSTGSEYSPKDNISGEGRSKEADTLACQSRCERIPDCDYFTFWADGGCHLSSGEPKRLSSPRAIAGPKVCGAGYVEGVDGENSCPTGYIKLLETDCQAYANSNAEISWVRTRGSGYLPSGCFLWNRTEVYYNKALEGHGNSGAVPICNSVVEGSVMTGSPCRSHLQCQDSDKCEEDVAGDAAAKFEYDFKCFTPDTVSSGSPCRSHLHCQDSDKCEEDVSKLRTWNWVQKRRSAKDFKCFTPDTVSSGSPCGSHLQCRGSDKCAVEDPTVAKDFKCFTPVERWTFQGEKCMFPFKFPRGRHTYYTCARLESDKYRGISDKYDQYGRCVTRSGSWSRPCAPAEWIDCCKRPGVESAFLKYIKTCIPQLTFGSGGIVDHHPSDIASESAHYTLMGYVTYNTRKLEALEPKCNMMTNECIEATLNLKNSHYDCPCTDNQNIGEIAERAGKAYGQCKTSIPGNQCFKVQRKYTAESILHQEADSSNDCQKLCEAHPKCLYWNWAYTNPHKEKNDCYLIDSNSDSTEIDAEKFVSGPKHC